MAAGGSIAVVLLVLVDVGCLVALIAVTSPRLSGGRLGGVLGLWAGSVVCTALLAYQLGRIDVLWEQG